MYNFLILKDNVNVFPSSDYTVENSFKTLGVCFLSYTFHFNVFPIFKSIDKPSDKRMVKVLIIGQSLVFILYSILSILGYCAFTE